MIIARNKITGEHRVFDGSNAPAYTGSDWEFLEADADGWIEWEGGECPLPEGAIHDVKFSDGTTLDEYERPESWYWTHKGSGSDIIAYRPILEKQATLADAKLWQGADGTIPCREGDPVGRVGEPPAWDGEGLPPVGCECEYISNDTSWGTVRVIGYDGDSVVFRPSGDRYYSAAPGPRDEFRPIRSEEERAVEDIADILDGRLGGLAERTLEAIGRELYRAGYRKTVAADGEDV